MRTTPPASRTSRAEAALPRPATPKPAAPAKTAAWRRAWHAWAAYIARAREERRQRRLAALQAAIEEDERREMQAALWAHQEATGEPLDLDWLDVVPKSSTEPNPKVGFVPFMLLLVFAALVIALALFKQPGCALTAAARSRAWR